MQKKTKLLTSVLLCGALVLAFTACAGCTGTDPIVGTWVKTYSDNSKLIYEFESPDVAYMTYVGPTGNVVLSDKADGNYTSVKKTGDNRYESGLLIFSVNDDGYTMTETLSNGNTIKFTKYSNYEVPTVSPTTSSSSKVTTSSNEPIIGAWKETETTYPNYYEFNADGSYIHTICFSTGKVSKYNLKWVKIADNHYQSSAGNYDFYLSSDGTTLTCAWDYDDTTHKDIYTRTDSSLIPAETKATTTATTKATVKPTSTPTSSVTLGEKNALQSAKDYLKYVGGYSRSGLMKQLEYEGFTSSEITYAINNCGANWNQQAAQSAKDYLEYVGGYSRSGLKEQLEYEGFTSSQIEYALSAVGY